MGQSFFLDDSVLCHSPCGHHYSLSFGNSGVLGLLCFNSAVPFTSFIFHEEDGLQGYAQGIQQESLDGAGKIEAGKVCGDR